ncbi:hypothetical protein G6F65_013641 [Rhizopus arrhizus]|nr:hypothetical protein G6F65_013641 [Rhizopus arrhizus]
MKYSTLTLEVAGHGNDPDHQQHRAEHRQGDVQELLPARGAVDARGLVKVMRDRLQAGQEDHHVVAEVLPHREQHDGRHRPVGIAQPVDRADAQMAQSVVHQPVAGMEQVAPDHCHRHQGGHHRGEQRGAEQRLEARCRCIEQHRRAQRHADRQRHADQHEVGGVPQRLPEHRCLQQIDVVAQADEAQVAAVSQRVEVEVCHAQRQRRGHRQAEDHPQQDQRRAGEDPAGK